MNVSETLILAKRMVELDDRCNTDMLSFFYSILLTEAKVLDAKDSCLLEGATDVILVFSFLYDRSVGKKNIFASRIIKEGYEKLAKICDDRLICESFIFSSNMLEAEEVIKERDYMVSDEGIQEFLDALLGSTEEEDEEDGES